MSAVKYFFKQKMKIMSTNELVCPQYFLITFQIQEL